MSYTITSTEYITIDGIPLSTPAWQTLELSELNNAADVRGSSIVIPRRPGQIFRNKVRDSKIVNIPIIIYGDRAPDNTIYNDKREGLLLNLDLLKKALANPYQPNDNQRLLTYYRPGLTLETAIQTTPNIQYEEINPTTARAIIKLDIASGAFRKTTDTTINQWVDDDTTFNIGIEGTGDVYGINYNIPGAANSLIIQNLTTGAALEYPDPINTGLNINTFTYSAIDNTTQVGGKIITTGTPYWVPLIAGTNQLRIIRDGGASVAISITYRAVYL